MGQKTRVIQSGQNKEGSALPPAILAQTERQEVWPHSVMGWREWRQEMRGCCFRVERSIREVAQSMSVAAAGRTA
jgi:hypothetical protein